MTALFARWYERLNDLWSAAVEAAVDFMKDGK